MDTLKNLIQRCHERRKMSLKQRRTVVTPAPHNTGHPYHMKTFPAFRYPVMLSDMEDSNISFMPIGRAPHNDDGPKELDDRRFLKRQKADDWSMRQWNASFGVQIFTGLASECNGAYWHDFHFTYTAISKVPDDVMSCLEVMIDSVANPLLTLTQHGGLRFTCRIPSYLHHNSDNAQFYIHKHMPGMDIPNDCEIYLKVKGNRGFNRWDARYEILLGDILEPPVIAKEVVFAPIDAMRAEQHQPVPKISSEEIIDITSHLTVISNVYEPKGKENSSDPEQIHLYPLKNLEPTKEIHEIRNGMLSPLALKRSKPVLSKSKHAENGYKSLQNSGVEIQDIFSQSDRILGLISDTEVEKKQSETETFVRSGSAVSLNVPTYDLAEKLEKRLEQQKIQLFQR